MDYKFIDIRQRHYMAFWKATKRLQPEEWDDINDLPPEVYMDLLVRAAIDAGWFEEPPDIDDMVPKDVDPIALAVAELYNNLKAPDPN
jgi:hypothetical protein